MLAECLLVKEVNHLVVKEMDLMHMSIPLICH